MNIGNEPKNNSNLTSYISSIFNFPLTLSQIDAVKKLHNFLNNDKKCFLLKGFAGTGKTTLLCGISSYLSNQKQTFKLMAPTGRAASVIQEKTKWDASTIHKSIYSNDNLLEYKETGQDGSETFRYFFGLKNNDDPANAIYIVDEASMISNQYSDTEFIRFGSGFLLNDLLNYIDFNNPKLNRKIIFVGDSAQLPPVNMKLSPAIDSIYLSNLSFGLTIEECEMTDVARQDKDSGILKNATKIRDNIQTKKFNKINIDENLNDIIPIKHEDLLSAYIKATANSNTNDIIIIAYSNKSVHHLNELVRNHFFPGKDEIQENDKVLIIRNNYKYKVLNGEFGRVKRINSETEKIPLTLKKKTDNITVTLSFRDITIEVPDINGELFEINCKIIETPLNSKEPTLTNDETRALYILFKLRNPNLKAGTPEFKEAIKMDLYFNSIQLKYGYAVTCHKAQGGEWNTTIVDFQTSNAKFNEEYFRWCYTALTRSKKLLYVLNNPNVGPSDYLKIIPAELVMKLSLSKNQTIVNDKITQAQEVKFGNELQQDCYHMVRNEMNSDTTIKNIKHFNYRERYEIESPLGSLTVDVIYSKNKITNIQVINSDGNIDDILNSLQKLCGKIILDYQEKYFSNEITFPENKPHLKEFYNDILTKISGTIITISKIEHNLYLEKYIFIRNNEVAQLNFYYNEQGRFVKCHPQEQFSNSAILIQELINLL